MSTHELTGALLGYAAQRFHNLCHGATARQERTNAEGWQLLWSRLSGDEDFVAIVASAAWREANGFTSTWLLPIILEKLEEHFAQNKQFRRCAEIVKRVYRLRAAQSMEMAERLLYSLSILRSLARVEHPVQATLDAAMEEIQKRLPEVQFPDRQLYLNGTLANVRIDLVCPRAQ